VYFHDILVIFFDILVSDNTIPNNEYSLIKTEKLKEEYCDGNPKNRKKEHEGDAEMKNAIHFCLLCKKKFKNLRTLRSHKSNDCGKTYSCEFCKKVFIYRASYCRHRKKSICSFYP